MNKLPNIFVFILSCMICFDLTGQESVNNTASFSPQEVWEAGLPYIQNFTPDDYKFAPQNWACLEGNDGIMYVGNGSGLMEFDGNSWVTLTLPNNSKINALAKSGEGIIYVAGYGEFGYLKKDSIGTSKYHSLSSKLDEEYSKFGNIWSIASIDGAVVFACYDFLFRWNGKEFKVWQAKSHFQDVFIVRDKVYIIDYGEGIMEFKDDNLTLIPKGKHFNSFKGRIAIMQPYQDDKILLGLPFEGLFIYDGKKINPLSSEIQQVFQEHEIYSGAKLFGGQYAIATYDAGVFIIDLEKEQVIRRYGKKQGLISDVLHNVYFATDGSIWLASDKGISNINLSLRTRKFDATNGLPEWVRATAYDGNTLFIGSQGVHILERNKQGKNYFDPSINPIQSIDQTVSSITPLGSHKLILQGPMVFDLDANNIGKRIKRGEVVRRATKSNFYHNTVYVASQLGNLYQFRLVGDDWEFKIVFSNKSEIVKVTEESNGDLWLSTSFNGVSKLRNKNVDSLNPDFELIPYDTVSGLPSMSQNFISNIGGKIYLTNENDGIYKFNKTTQRFLKDTVLMDQFDGKIDLFGSLQPDKYGNVWHAVMSGNNNRLYQIKGGKIAELSDYRLYGDFPTFNISAVDSSVVLLTGPKGIVAYNKAAKKPRTALHPVQIRKVLLEGDSLVYAGKGGVDNKQFSYTLNSMRFEYSLPYFTKPKNTEYQFELEGFDKGWSSWTIETQKDYTNIPEGNYAFKVRAKNVFGKISEEDRFTFTILPPWYRTWWAYALYLLGGILAILLFSQWRSQQLRNKNEILEQLVDDRTNEIKQKHLQLEDQAERLKEMDIMKTRLFANISHEFRTPLTLIKGPVEKMEMEGNTNLSTANVKMIRRNSNRLLNLVNQLLDLSKLDSGKLQLNPAEGDVFKCLRAAASSFASHAAQRDTDYQISIPSRPLWADFDRDKIEKIAYNLLSNAFKFTPDKGKISAKVSYRSGRLQLTVSDSGQGIHKEKLPFIFDRFFQVDDSYTREKSGSGIGLALTKELVVLMQGEIYVESEFGKGSMFKVILDIEEIKSGSGLSEVVYSEITDQMDAPPKIEHVDNLKTKEYSVMVIEDNNDMRHFIKEQLQDEYQVLEAVNGKEGLKQANKTIPDLIITDLMMPQMDGITLCKKLKTSVVTSHIPVVMLTAKAGIENKLEGLETGADDYLTKPFDARELQVRVKNLIAERQRLRELFAQKSSVDPKEIAATSLDQKFLAEVLQLLEEKHIEPDFGVPEMQKQLGMSKTQLHRKLKSLTDHPPGELLRNFRLKRAAQLLKQHGDNISQVAYSVGFNGLSYFTKCFRELYGMSPSDYIDKHKS